MWLLDKPSDQATRYTPSTIHDFGEHCWNHNLTSFQQIEENDLRRRDLLLYGASDQGLNLYTDL